MQVRVCAVIPVLNEEKFIKRCIDSLLAQTFPVDILVLDGGSTDSTLDILDSYGDSIRVIDNPGKRVPNARNLALQHLGENITHCLEIIGHSWIDNDHVEKRVNDLIDLESNLGIKVGAIGCLTESADSDDHVSSWIEGALRSPIGSGGGQFQRFEGRNQTKVPAFCLHNVEALKSVDGWDERFITSQDSDLSMRMRNKGYQLYRTSDVKVQMAKRSTLQSWAKMGFRYGFWRTRLLKRHHNRISFREYLPWLGFILTTILFLSGVNYWYLPIIIYSIALLFEGTRISLRWRHISLIIGIPIVIVILHSSFSLGLLYGVIGKPKSFNERESKNGNLD